MPIPEEEWHINDVEKRLRNSRHAASLDFHGGEFA
jgi:hypothetical protein